MLVSKFTYLYSVHSVQRESGSLYIQASVGLGSLSQCVVSSTT